MPDGKKEKPPPGLMNLLILPTRRTPSPKERTLLNLQLKTTTTSSLKTKKNPDSTKMKPRNSLSSSVNKPPLVTKNRLLTPKKPLEEIKNVISLEDLRITSAQEQAPLKNLL